MTNISKTAHPFLSGKEFSSGLLFNVKPDSEQKHLGRIPFLTDYVKGKSVIHLGCCDHLPLIKNKISKNQWLHKLVTEVSTECVGVDIDQEGISFLKDELKCDNVVCADILNDDIKELESKQWDVMIIGEVLEHIPNPVEFLSKLSERYKGKVNTLILTVPNAFCISNFKDAFKGYEYINTDHKYWFTPFTLAKILTLSGFTPDSFTFAQYGSARGGSGLRSYLNYRLIKSKPIFRESLIFISKF